MYSANRLVCGALFFVISLHLTVVHVQCQTSGRAVFISGPETQVVAPGDIAHFNCHARGNSVYWYVNDQDPGLTEEYYMAKGFTFIYDDIDHGPNVLEEHNNTISVEARLANNDTKIACTATGTVTNQHVYQEGRLIIAGPPLTLSVQSISLEIEYNMSSNTFSFTLNWSRPFTWPGFPVNSYTITLSNYSTTDPLHTTTVLNSADLESPGHQVITTDGHNCYLIGFSLKANNSLGESNQTYKQFGHPIIIDEIGEIEALVTFHSNTTPHMWISFLAPRVCPGYQIGSYNISIYAKNTLDNSSSLIYHFGPADYTQVNVDERTLLAHELRSGIYQGSHYEVEVTVESYSMIRTRRKSFYTEVLSTCPMPQTTTSTTTVTGITVVNGPQTSMDMFGVTVGVTVLSLIIITVLIAVVVLLVFALKYRRRKERDFIDGGHSPNQKRARFRIENTNPIYEGAALYETMPGELLINKTRPPPPNVSTPADLSRYVEPPPSLPPPRVDSEANTQPEDDIDAIKLSIKQDNLLNFEQPDNEYMVMGPINSKSAAKSKTGSLKLSNTLTRKTSDSGMERQNSEEKYVTLDELCS